GVQTCALPIFEIQHLKFEPPGVNLRQVENVVDKAEERLARVVDGSDELALPLVEVGLAEETAESDDRVEGRAKLVAHRGQKLGLRLREVACLRHSSIERSVDLSQVLDRGADAQHGGA